jgi:hypothetical protein
MKALRRLRRTLAPFVSPFKAIIQLAPYLYRVRNRPELREVQRSYLWWMPLNLFSEPIHWLRMLLTSRRRYAKADQRPYRFYVPHLSSVPFPEPDATARSLESDFEAIAREYWQVAEEEVPSPNVGRLVDRGKWTSFHLSRDARPIEENIARCPRTWAAANRCALLKGMVGLLYFSILEPGTHVRPHCGPTNLRLRYHLGIETDEGAVIRCGDEWSTWTRGECLVLDDSFEHEVRHEGTRRRVVLIVDCWHPQLTDAEREFLTKVHRVPEDRSWPAPDTAPGTGEPARIS